MTKNEFIGNTLGSASLPITVDRSRCLRMRLNKNKCRICTSNCRAGAILMGDAIRIDTGKCTLCMVCVSECPADCFEIKGDDFFSLLARLRRVQGSACYPVLGCKTASATDAHEKMACLGALSEKHLIAIYAFMDGRVQLNLTSCRKCCNSFIVETLKKRVANIRETAGIDLYEKIVVVEDSSDLRFQPVSCDRRNFFSSIKNMTILHASGLFGRDSGDPAPSYSEKKLPLKKDILNRIVRKGADRDTAERLLHEYAYRIRAGGTCDNCFSCIAMCPTGALKGNRDESGTALLFNPSMCIGCGLCRDFCLNNSITLLHGCPGENYFEHEICNNEPCTVHSTGDDCRDGVVVTACSHGH